MYEAEETDERVLFHYGRLFERYPRLSGLKQSVMDAYLALRDCFEGGGKLLLCGNGGSCADAEHIAGELMKGFYLKRPVSSEEPLSRLQGALCAVPLTGSGALATAFMNDVSPEYVFAQQVLGLGRRGDVLLAISTSGNAKNVLAAVKTAKALGIGTVALTGGTGGRLAEECGLHIIAPGNSPADVQECHLPIYHTLCAMLEAHFYKE
ncbi:MAG: SIS domain-containing protein [Clostridia bacterium]|nr:SIS domain-containing protein [Clostridia bacterium]MBR5752454.1 SIS domain-containing protein [Clostridia bacterium]